MGHRSSRREVELLEAIPGVGYVEPLIPPVPLVVAHLEQNILGRVTELEVAPTDGGITSCIAKKVQRAEELEARSNTQKLLTQISECG